ncbi:MAG: YggT family protein [Chloroflexi bacterium]|nr:YggT family protein [Chloroflexota bacterium]MCI0579133.1 YggT family protein [Chloroflexota bacterium]MCI0643350.1 YggT family protein [Chloroflexota bacterium]MCI0728329.1 YggT family protein [Chloroflexota bacterium]
MIGLLILLIDLLYYALFVLIIARIIMSFARFDPYHPISRTVYNLTEPILEPIRRILPPAGGLDFSPMVTLLAAILIRELLKGVLLTLL